MKDISRTLIIGLGGTGQTVIRDIKKRLFRRCGEIPPLVKFLAFDTDNDEYQDTPFNYYYEGEIRETKKYNLQIDEFRRICFPSIDRVKNESIFKNINNEEWGILHGLTNSWFGARFRINGRASFLNFSGEIMAMLCRAVNELRGASISQFEMAAKGYHVVNNNISVYVIASLAGGTGSSAIMDISRMLQHAGINMTPQSASTWTDNIFGMFFTPSFFESKPNTSHIWMNAYASLSELDYTLGLNDRVKYPLGCKELEDDLNEYEGYIGYQPVRYSGIYLIDSKTKRGHYHSSLWEASGPVASYITSSIAAPSNVLSSSYSNSTHCMHEVEGKKQLYSGLGYCEIRFDRQNFVNYWLNRQLLELLAPNNDSDKRVDVKRLIDVFFENHCLNSLPEVIAGVHDVSVSVRRMGEVNPNREAAKILKNERTRYLHDVDVSTTAAVRAFGERRSQLLQDVKDYLNDCQVKMGVGVCRELVEHLLSRFINVRDALVEEMTRHPHQMRQLEDELYEIENRIARANPFFLLINNNRRALEKDIRDYRNKVEVALTETPTLGGLRLEMIRKEEAIAIFDELIHEVELYYEKAGQLYSAYRDLFNTVNNAYKPSKAAKNEVIFVDAYLKEYFNNHPSEVMALPGQVFEEMNRYICQLCDDGPRIDSGESAMRHHLLELLPDDNLIKRIWRYEMSLDQLFIDCFGKADDIADDHDFITYPQLGIFGQLDSLFDILWQYNDFSGPNSIPAARNCVVGVYNTDFHILDRNNGYGAFLPNNYAYQYINIGDPDKIVFMLQETAIPAFALEDAEKWSADYERNKRRYYAFTDKRLEYIDMICPVQTSEEAEIAWAYGWLFGLLASVKGRIQVKPSEAYVVREKCVLTASGYYDYFIINSQKPNDLSSCHRQFIKDKGLFGDIYAQAMTLLDVDKAGLIVKIFHWVNDGKIWLNRGKLPSSMSGGERLVIQNEPEYLAKCFEKLSSEMLSISFDVNTMRVKYEDSTGILAQKEQEYQQAGEARD